MLIVHLTPKNHSGYIYARPDIQVFAESWFQWLDRDSPAELSIYEASDFEDGKLCEIHRIDQKWYVVCRGHKGKYRKVIGTAQAVTFENLEKTLRLVRSEVMRAEGAVPRQDFWN